MPSRQERAALELVEVEASHTFPGGCVGAQGKSLMTCPLTTQTITESGTRCDFWANCGQSEGAAFKLVTGRILHPPFCRYSKGSSCLRHHFLTSFDGSFEQHHGGFPRNAGSSTELGSDLAHLPPGSAGPSSSGSLTSIFFPWKVGITKSSWNCWEARAVPMDRRAWQATAHGVAESGMTERLSTAQHRASP